MILWAFQASNSFEYYFPSFLEPKHEEETEIQDPGTDDIDTTGTC